MKQRELFHILRALSLVVAIAAFSGVADMVTGPAVQAQEDDDKKVIQKTTDKSGKWLAAWIRSGCGPSSRKR